VLGPIDKGVCESGRAGGVCIEERRGHNRFVGSFIMDTRAPVSADTHRPSVALLNCLSLSLSLSHIHTHIQREESERVRKALALNMPTDVSVCV